MQRAGGAHTDPWGGRARIAIAWMAVIPLRHAAMNEPREGTSDDVERPISAAAERIETIIDAATRAASEIRGEAREDAERHLEEAEREAERLTTRRIGLLSELTDSLIERAEKVRKDADELARAMEEVMRALAATMSEPGAPDRRDEPER